MSTGLVPERPPQVTDLLSRIRFAELQGLRGLFPAGANVLEIGGGNGFQAACLAAWGFSVSSVDTGPSDWEMQHYPVIPYDGTRLPFRDGVFDVIFSSNVLEHVICLRRLLAEARRVMHAGGRAIHVLPTSAWRVWTSIAHYPWLAEYLLFGRRGGHGRPLPAPSDVLQRRGIWGAMQRALVPSAHGVDASSSREIITFGRQRWLREFEECGFIVERDWPMGLFYTGYSAGQGLDLRLRQALATVCGSACRAYLLKAAERGASALVGASGGAAA
ncbi:MAG: class I SAM-dependent methyltransferase [Candidatus Methylophosphatis roskildensis]